MLLNVAYFLDKLVARASELQAEEAQSAVDRAPVALDQDSVGRLSRIDAMQIQAMALAQQRRRQSERAAIDAALRRIEADEYGHCLQCGDGIAVARLEYNPAVQPASIVLEKGNLRNMPADTVEYVGVSGSFGFISRDDKQPMVFLHLSEVKTAWVDSIRKGQRWVFDVEDRGGSNLVAVDVCLDTIEIDHSITLPIWCSSDR